MGLRSHESSQSSGVKGTSSRKPSLPTFPFPHSEHTTYRLPKCLQILFSPWLEKNHGAYEIKSKPWPSPRTVWPVHRLPLVPMTHIPEFDEAAPGEMFSPLLSPRSTFFPSSRSGWLRAVSPKFQCRNPDPQHLITSPYLEMGVFKEMIKVT